MFTFGAETHQNTQEEAEEEEKKTKKKIPQKSSGVRHRKCLVRYQTFPAKNHPADVT